MTLYRRRQVLVLLILLAVAGLGLAVGHWRRARPDLADSLEQLDRAPAPGSSLATPPSTLTTPQSETEAASESSPPEPAPRRSRRGKAPPGPASLRGAPIESPSPALDLNRASAAELTRLPGIGPALARRIVDARDAEGPFARVDELGRVRGMSARKVAQLRALVTIAE